MLKHRRPIATAAAAVTLSVAVFGTAVQADENDAKQILRTMSDYMSGQTGMAFDYDATLEVVTTEDQILGIASSGMVEIARPNKIHATRTGGFADVEMAYDGQSFGMVGKNVGRYVQTPFTGTIEALFEELGSKYSVPFPAADLLFQNPYDLLMSEVSDIKDLGAGVIGGRTCDHLAFRTDKVDWQIWVAQGDAPFPCRYEITTRGMAMGPGYRVDINNWRDDIVPSDSSFVLNVPASATEITMEDFQAKAGLLPDHYKTGENK